MTTPKMTTEERECLVTCEGCSVHLPMQAAICDPEDVVYLCAKCACGMVASEKDAIIGDLLAACEGAIRRCENQLGGYVGQDGQFIKTMRAAVAKAKGGAE
jgi:hypothetical protein